MFKKIPINYISAFVIFIVVILWIFSGLIGGDEAESNVSEVVTSRGNNICKGTRIFFTEKNIFFNYSRKN